MSAIQVILFTSLSILGAIAIPFPQGPPTSETVNCDDISKYTTEFFVANRRLDPEISSCLFYTSRQGDIAKRLTEGSRTGTITIWDVWPCDLYSRDNIDSNPLRCIMNSDTQRQTYFENMSRAYAQLCSLYVSLVTPDVYNIPTDGIWALVEQPALERDSNFDPPLGKVDTIQGFTPDFNTNKRIFTRPGTGPHRRNFVPALNSTLTARSPPGNLPNCVPAGTVEDKYGDINCTNWLYKDRKLKNINPGGCYKGVTRLAINRDIGAYLR